MFRTYHKKPVKVEATQFNGGVVGEYFIGWKIQEDEKGQYLVIQTLEGDHRANVGDYIICGIMGEYYPCKPDIFKKTYEPVEGK